MMPGRNNLQRLHLPSEENDLRSFGRFTGSASSLRTPSRKSLFSGVFVRSVGLTVAGAATALNRFPYYPLYISYSGTGRSLLFYLKIAHAQLPVNPHAAALQDRPNIQ
jgi:hypothetical protein